MFSLLYRIILHGCPADIRAEHRAEMEEIARWLTASRRPGTRALAYGRAILDLIGFVVSVRRHHRALPQSKRNRRPRVSKWNQDIRTAFRQLRVRPAFTAAIIGMLALGLGASAAIFSVVYGVLLKPLPFPEADRLVEVWGSVPARAIDATSLAEANTWDLRDLNQTFSEMGALHGASFTLTGGDVPERLSGARVGVGFLRALGVQPIAGRLFEPGEDDPGATRERVIISERLWNRRFGGDRHIVGMPIMLDGSGYEVMGVLPRGPLWLANTDVFVPLIRRTNADRGSWEYAMVGRIKPGITFPRSSL
jgi:putative ABC transport system permease protein